MFRRKKKEPQTDQPPSPEVARETAAAEPEVSTSIVAAEAAAAPERAPVAATEPVSPVDAAPVKSARGNRVQKVGIVSSDKMQKTVVVRVDRQVLHMKYRRYVRRTTKFKAHDDLGASVGDRVRIV